MGLAGVRSRTARGGEQTASGTSVLDWTRALASCEGPADLAAVIHHVACTDDAALARLHQFLEEAAERARQLPDATHVAHAIDNQMRALDEIGDALDQVSVDLVDVARNTAPGEPTDARTQAAQSPSPGISAPSRRTGARPRPQLTATDGQHATRISPGGTRPCPPRPTGSRA